MLKYGYRVAARIRKLYWFVFRPRTFGVKCVVQHEGRFLMIRNTYGKGHWTFPGGSIDRGETPDQAAQREVHEEVGIRLNGLKEIGSYYSDREYKRDTVYCFTADATSLEHRIDPKEIAEAMWVDPEAIPSFHGPSVDRILAMLR